MDRTLRIGAEEEKHDNTSKARSANVRTRNVGADVTQLGNRIRSRDGRVFLTRVAQLARQRAALHRLGRDDDICRCDGLRDRFRIVASMNIGVARRIRQTPLSVRPLVTTRARNKHASMFYQPV